MLLTWHFPVCLYADFVLAQTWCLEAWLCIHFYRKIHVRTKCPHTVNLLDLKHESVHNCNIHIRRYYLRTCTCFMTRRYVGSVNTSSAKHLSLWGKACDRLGPVSQWATGGPEEGMGWLWWNHRVYTSPVTLYTCCLRRYNKQHTHYFYAQQMQET